VFDDVGGFGAVDGRSSSGPGVVNTRYDMSMALERPLPYRKLQLYLIPSHEATDLQEAAFNVFSNLFQHFRALKCYCSYVVLKRALVHSRGIWDSCFMM
jgi:hypothetical protein